MRERLRSHDGANAVEFALVLPILVMLIFGAITAGLALNSKQQLDHAAREGARYAATLPYDDDVCNGTDDWEVCVRDRVVATSVGTVDLADGGGVCVAYLDDTPTTESYYYGSIENDDGDKDATKPCMNESTPLSGARVQVKVQTPAFVDAVFVRTGLFDLEARSISRYEVPTSP